MEECMTLICHIKEIKKIMIKFHILELLSVIHHLEGARVSIANNSIKNISPRDGVSTPKQNIIQIDRTRVDIPRYSSDMNLIGVYSRNNRN